MLTIEITVSESYDEVKEEFVIEKVKLDLEHSLVSLSKWESEFQKPFLSDEPRTEEELFRYIELMCLTPNVPREILLKLSKDNIAEIDTYLNKKHTATTIRELPGTPRSREVITAELIYYWMFELGIPKDLETWHLSRLFTQIKVVNLKKQPPKKMGKRESAQQRHALNAARRQKLGTRG